MFELVDKSLLRSLFNSHSKTSSAFLHLETATIPIRYIIASRRINYLHNILTRNENEVVSRVYFAQKAKPLQGDFVKLVESDLQLINLQYNESFFKSMSKNKFKKFIKLKIRNAAFQYLNNERDKKEKVKHIVYKKFKIQNYLKSASFSNFEIEILSKLRSRNINVKDNFKSKFTHNNVTNLECSIDNCFENENQQHLLKCRPVIEKMDKMYSSDISYNHIFSNCKKQKKVTEIYVAILDIRNEILKKQEST